jgi:hypothetical protein
MTIHIVFTQQYIVVVLQHKYITYNSITVLHHSGATTLTLTGSSHV